MAEPQGDMARITMAPPCDHLGDAAAARGWWVGGCEIGVLPGGQVRYRADVLLDAPAATMYLARPWRCIPWSSMHISCTPWTNTCAGLENGWWASQLPVVQWMLALQLPVDVPSRRTCLPWVCRVFYIVQRVDHNQLCVVGWPSGICTNHYSGCP